MRKDDALMTQATTAGSNYLNVQILQRWKSSWTRRDGQKNHKIAVYEIVSICVIAN